MKAGRAALYYGAHAATGALVLASIPAIHGVPLRVPVTYSRDGVMMTVFAKAIAEDGLFHAAHIGAPFGADLVDWPFGTWLPLGTIALLNRALGEPGTAINLYWMATILFAGLAATWCLRRLRIRPGLAFVLGMLYGFQPYVFYRNVEHVNLTFPFIPFLALLCLRVAGTHPEDDDRRERAVSLAACVAQGFSYVYYTFFACLLLVAAGAIGWIRTGSSAFARRATAAIVVLTGCTAITIAPSLVVLAGARAEPLPRVQVGAGDGQVRHEAAAPARADHGPPGGAAARGGARRRARRLPRRERERLGDGSGRRGAIGLVALLLFLLGRAAGLLPGRDDALDARRRAHPADPARLDGGRPRVALQRVREPGHPRLQPLRGLRVLLLPALHRHAAAARPRPLADGLRVSRRRCGRTALAGLLVVGPARRDPDGAPRAGPRRLRVPVRGGRAPSCARSSRACRRARWCSSCRT